MDRRRYATLIGLACTSACAAQTPFDRPSVEVAIAALALGDATDAVWDIEVRDGGGGIVFQVRATSERFGDGHGSATYVGPCVAGEDNTVSVWLRGVYTAVEPLTADPGAFGEDTPADDAVLAGSADFVSPGKLTRTFMCRENEDVRVDFDVTVMRPARQGFFDIAIDFDDIFCSAKFDLGLEVDRGNGPVCEDHDFLHNPDAGNARDRTAVLAVVCTTGSGDPGTTTLYLDTITITCPDQVITIEPCVAEGNLRDGATWTGVSSDHPSGTTAIPGRVYQIHTTSGIEPHPSYDLRYWSLALGIADLDGCSLSTRITADDPLDPVAVGESSPLTIDGDEIYPVIDVLIPDLGACALYPLSFAGGPSPTPGVSGHYSDGTPVVFERQCPAPLGPTCTDTVLNGDETGVDCGGSCPPCEVGASFRSINAGWDQTCAIALDGSGWCWGNGQGGQLGNGAGGATTPDPIDNLDGTDSLLDVTSLSIGWSSASPLIPDNTCASTGDGAAWCWGENLSGVLALGDTSAHTRPTRVVGPTDGTFLDDVAMITTGARHACVLRRDGTAWCWGQNGGAGCIGDGTTTARFRPVQVIAPSGSGHLEDVVAISAGHSYPGECYTCAVTDDGSALCWGNAENGVLGHSGTSGAVPTPARVKGPGGIGDFDAVAQIVAGWEHTCAIRNDGSAWCWGRGESGELGDGATLDRPYPVAVVGLPSGVPVVSISPGKRFTCASLADGSAWCWGRNDHGTIGDGTSTPSAVPRQVVGPDGLGTLGNVANVSAGNEHACALGRDTFQAWCWGYNLDGQLGIGQMGSTLPSLTPEPVQW